MVVGVFAATVDFSVTWGCQFYVHIVLANTVGFIAASVVNFGIAHVWVFNREIGEKQLALFFCKVFFISLIGLGISNAIVWLMIAQGEMSFFWGKSVAAITALVWNYGARLLLVYNK